MKITLTHKKTMVNGRPVTTLTHIKAMTDDGKYIKFAKHTPALLDYLDNIEINTPERLLE